MSSTRTIVELLCRVQSRLAFLGYGLHQFDEIHAATNAYCDGSGDAGVIRLLRAALGHSKFSESVREWIVKELEA